ncbi:hypothetical protein QAD02_021215 [Eretmocerus hayati]|uniref:Uncharacterized protein n=1 Tax=Eretmocerus hayati TaxID=131215 RepID=A0ACC2PSU4_9HYME|nr:hypothetical protein QAD02_021215 [Eretmocerus hayati]
MKSLRFTVVGVDPCMINTPNVNIETDIYNRNEIDKNQQIKVSHKSNDYPKERFIKDMHDLDFKKDLRNYIIIGDFNINILENDKYSNELLNNFYETAYEPYFSEETRISSNVSDGTCIDNAFIRTNLNIEFYRIDQPFTDYYPLLLRASQPIHMKRISHNTRNQINYKIIVNKASEEIWEDILRLDDVNVATDLEKCQKLVGKSKIESKINNGLRKPWVTKGILAMISEKQNVYKRMKGNGNTVIRAEYKEIEKNMKNRLRIEKDNYERKSLKIM